MPRAGAGRSRGRHAAEDEVEIAVVVGVHQRARRGRSRVGQAGDGGDVREPRPIVVEQARAARAQDEEVGPRVVVDVGGHGSEAGQAGIEAPARGGVDEAAALLEVEAQALGPDGDEVEMAVPVDVREGEAARRRGDGHGRRRPRRARHPAIGGVDELVGRCGGLHELRLRARGGQGLGVAPLLGVVVGEERRVSALLQRAEAVHRPLPLLGLAGADEGQAEVVDGGGVVRLRGQGRAQLHDGFRVVAVLEEELAEVDVGAQVRGVDGEDGAERRPRLLGRAQAARGQAQDVMRLRHAGQGRRRRAGLEARLLQLGHVEERDGEVRARQGQGRIQRERLAEGSHRVVVPELLEQRHPDVVRAVRGLHGIGGNARCGRVGGGRGDDERKGEAEGGQRRAWPHGERTPARGAIAGSLTRPWPSLTVMRSSARASTVSTRPLGQRTSTFTAPVVAPRPKVRGSSLWEA